MDWLNIHISTSIRSPEYVGSSPAERGTWTSVLAYACEIECGGRLVGAAHWKDRQWQQACGVTLREVKAASRLMRFDGDDLVVNGYPVAKEQQVKQARGVGMAGAMKRWGKGDADRHAVSMPTGIADGNAEGKGREGKGKEPALHAASPPPEQALSTWVRWQRKEPDDTAEGLVELRQLIATHGPKLVQQHAERLAHAAAGKVWPNQLSDALLTASRPKEIPPKLNLGPRVLQ